MTFEVFGLMLFFCLPIVAWQIQIIFVPVEVMENKSIICIKTQLLNLKYCKVLLKSNNEKFLN